MDTQGKIRGFTLVELLVVIGIIVILTGLLFPVILHAREKGRQRKCFSNQRQIYMEIMMYAQDHGESLPDPAVLWHTIQKTEPDLLVCPSTGARTLPDYVYNDQLSDRPLAEIENANSELLTADGSYLDSLLLYFSINYPHDSSSIQSYLDGHATANKQPSAWPMFHFTSTHNGRATVFGPSSSGQKWAFSTNGPIGSSPVIDSEGTIYVGSNLKLYAITPDGSSKWEFATGGPVSAAPAIGDDGTIYVGSWDNKLYALYPDRSLKWTVTTGAYIESSPMVANNAVYFGSDDGHVYAMSSNGTPLWSTPFTTGGAVTSSPVIDSHGIVYVGSEDGNLYALKSDGTKKWAFPTGAAISNASPAIAADGTIYIGSEDTKLYAINPDGTLKWAFATGAPIHSSPALSSDGTIYVGSDDKKLHALSADGAQKWSYLTGDTVASSPLTSADGSVYFGSSDGKVYALANDGTLKWQYQTGSSVASSPALGANGTLYIGSFDDKLYALGP